ncbi:universal stress protein [Nonomuraea sp. NPDC048901]|uniref:universal stress protein n=1 Tax=Nonomuraea sp. NPDC048901 TaxID=3155627 RepID=UPI0033E76D51
MSRAIVVGVDGSPSAGSALGWAADDASRRGLPLRIVLVREPWAAEHPSTRASDRQTLTERCTYLLDQAAEQVRRLTPELEVSTAVVTGSVIERLKGESETADSVVVGSRGLGGFAGLVLGSVGLGLAGHAHSPVVVVRMPVPGRHREIVVGFDGSPFAESALEYALEQAGARRAPVRVVYGQRTPRLAPHPAGYGPFLTGAPGEEVAEIRLRLAPWHEKYPDVEVIESIVPGHPVPVLARASEKAALVVVGSRGLGGFASAALGSVSHGVLHRACCPVAVVQTPWRRS